MADNSNVRVAVIGGGPAGLSAALAAVETSANVLLIDDASKLGGHLVWSTSLVQNIEEYAGMRSLEVAEKLSEWVIASKSIKVLTRATAFGMYSEGLMGVEDPDGLVEVEASRYVFTPGRTDRIPVFVNNDLPGIISSTAARILINRFKIKPGNCAIIYSNNDDGLRLASELHDVETKVNAVIEERESPSAETVEELTQQGIPVYPNSQVIQANGRKCLNSIEFVTLSGLRRKIDCDVLCFSIGSQPLCELPQQVGCQVEYDQSSKTITIAHDEYLRSTPESYVAGEVIGAITTPQILLHGRLAGLSAALSLGFGASSEYREQRNLVIRNRQK